MVIQHAEQLTPKMLTEILAKDGALRRGCVESIVDSGKTLNKGNVSNVASLVIQYSADAEGDLPGHLFLKMSKPDIHPEIQSRNRHEVAFYQEMARMGTHLPVPHCYSTEVNSEGQTHILMDDYAETHHQKPLPIPPSNIHCEMIVDDLARLHASWWNDPRLGNGLGELPTEDQIRAIRDRLENTYPQFVDFLGDALLPAQRKTLEHTLASPFLSQMEKLLLDRQEITLVHGDAHTGNFLLPRDNKQHRVILIDWHLWGVYFGANDLAFMIALHWTPQRRSVLERRLLERYHRVLVESGVNHYRFEQLWDDYRRSVILMTLIPIGQFRRKQAAGVIWYGLQHSMAAFDDLHCSELLAS